MGDPKVSTPVYLMPSGAVMRNVKIHIFSCDQAALWMAQSVRPSEVKGQGHWGQHPT